MKLAALPMFGAYHQERFLPYVTHVSELITANRRAEAIKYFSLVLEGTESPSSLRHGAHALANVLPNAQLVSKKGLGHTKKLETKMIASELAAFFMGNY